MGKRRAARERAVQILYQIEFNETGLEDMLRAFWADQEAAADVREYAEWLVRGIVAQRTDIDAILRGVAENWRISRMAAVDRNILRLAVFELTESKIIPAPAVIIDEAIEIARRFSGEEAAVFVNGVLDAVRKRLGRTAGPTKDKDHDQRTQDQPTRAPRGRRGASTERSRTGPGRKL